MTLKGKVAVVTGGGSGIGRAIVHEFYRGGASVVAIGRNQEKLDAAVSTLPETGRVHTQVTDVLDGAQIEQAMRATVERFGHIDILCNNAGTHEAKRIDELPLETWNLVLATNLTGPFLCSKYAIPHMIRSGGGSIVNIGSVASVMAVTSGAAYIASKHGLVGLTRTLAFQYGHAGIRANCLCPGMVSTEMTAAAQDNSLYMQFVQKLAAKRLGTTEEIARAVAFLAGDACDYVTGATWMVDGGFTMAQYRR
jgi:NAD(P)-dependent dehydrogenase (short-subunit alcohol dehydrogenase family)